MGDNSSRGQGEPRAAVATDIIRHCVKSSSSCIWYAGSLSGRRPKGGEAEHAEKGRGKGEGKRGADNIEGMEGTRSEKGTVDRPWEGKGGGAEEPRGRGGTNRGVDVEVAGVGSQDDGDDSNELRDGRPSLGLQEANVRPPSCLRWRLATSGARGDNPGNGLGKGEVGDMEVMGGAGGQWEEGSVREEGGGVIVAAEAQRRNTVLPGGGGQACRGCVKLGPVKAQGPCRAGERRLPEGAPHACWPSLPQ